MELIELLQREPLQYEVLRPCLLVLGLLLQFADIPPARKVSLILVRSHIRIFHKALSANDPTVIQSLLRLLLSLALLDSRAQGRETRTQGTSDSVSLELVRNFGFRSNKRLEQLTAQPKTKPGEEHLWTRKAGSELELQISQALEELDRERMQGWFEGDLDQALSLQFPWTWIGRESQQATGRRLYIEIVCALLQSESPSVVSAVLSIKGFCTRFLKVGCPCMMVGWSSRESAPPHCLLFFSSSSSTRFQGLPEDPPAVALRVLRVFRESILMNRGLSRSQLQGFFNTFVLEQLTSVQETAGAIDVRMECFGLLHSLLVGEDPSAPPNWCILPENPSADGIVEGDIFQRFRRAESRAEMQAELLPQLEEGKQRRVILANDSTLVRILHLLSPQTSSDAALLVLRTLRSRPEILPGYMNSLTSSAQPRPSSQFFRSVWFLCALFTVTILPPLSGPTPTAAAPDPEAGLTTLLRCLLPPTLTRNIFSQGLQHSSPGVRYAVASLAGTILDRFLEHRVQLPVPQQQLGVSHLAQIFPEIQTLVAQVQTSDPSNDLLQLAELPQLEQVLKFTAARGSADPLDEETQQKEKRREQQERRSEGVIFSAGQVLMDLDSDFEDTEDDEEEEETRSLGDGSGLLLLHRVQVKLVRHMNGCMDGRMDGISSSPLFLFSILLLWYLSHVVVISCANVA